MMFRIFLKLYKNRCIFPAYHCVSNERPPHLEYLYPVRTQKEFIADLDFLLRHYKPVSMQSILEHPGRLHEKHAFHLTFDDGLREMYDVVVPILEKKGIPATFFINPSFLDNKELFYRFKISLLLQLLDGAPEKSKKEAASILGLRSTSFKGIRSSLLQNKKNNEEILEKLRNLLNTDFTEFLQNYKPYMDTTQVRTLVEKGFTLGGHSMNHPYYPHLILEEQIAQTIKSADFIQDTFDLNYRLFAFPYTDHRIGSAFFNYIYGENKLLDYSFGTAGIKDDCYNNNLQRIFVEDFNHIKYALAREYAEYAIKKVLKRNVIQRE